MGKVIGGEIPLSNKPDNRFYVYIHRRADDGRVFYVGKGTGRRAWSFSHRGDWWKRVKNKHGCSVDIYMDGLCEADALRYEVAVIWGMRFIGEPLVNVTDGGEGVSGWIHTDEWRKKVSAANKGRKKPDSFKEALSKRSKEQQTLKKLLSVPGFIHKRNMAIKKKDVFTFYNEGEGKLAVCTQSEFERYTGGSSGGVSSLVSGRRKSLYKWVILT